MPFLRSATHEYDIKVVLCGPPEAQVSQLGHALYELLDTRSTLVSKKTALDATLSFTFESHRWLPHSFTARVRVLCVPLHSRYETFWKEAQRRVDIFLFLAPSAREYLAKTLDALAALRQTLAQLVSDRTVPADHGRLAGRERTSS